MRISSLLALSLALCSGQLMLASVVFSDFDLAPNLYNGSYGVDFTGSSTAPGRSDLAFAFVPTESYDLTGLDIALSYSSGTNDAVVSLRSDDAGLPGTALQAWISGPLPDFATCCSIEAFSAFGKTTLIAGQQYWVVAVANGSDSDLIWDFNSISASGSFADSKNGVTFGKVAGPSLLGAFQVLGTPVPEPSSAIPLVLLLGLMVWRFQVRTRITRDTRRPIPAR